MTDRTTSHQRRLFAERIANAPILLDGAMGTLLFSRGVPQRASLDELVISRPDLIGAIHREYIEAGADAIETNSFGANRFRLAPYGLSANAAALNRKAAQIAREARDVAGKRDVLVAGSIGPLESPLHGPDAPREEDVRAAFREQIEGLLEGGVDFLLFETFSDLGELLIGISEAQALGDLPIVAQMTFGEDLIAVDGTSPADRRDGARTSRRRRDRRQLRRGAADLPRCPDTDGPAIGRAGAHASCPTPACPSG